MNDRKNEIKRENRKSLKTFILILVISGFIGGLIGGFGNRFSNGLREGMYNLGRFVPEMAPYLMIGAAVIAHVFFLFQYRSSRKLLETWDGDTEELPEIIDRKIGYIMWVEQMNMIFSFMLFAVGVCDLNEGAGNGVLFILICFVINCTVIIISQQKCVDIQKEMNPEKAGSVYDLKFQRKWLNSCDEAEKMQTYQCAWASFKFMNTAYVIMWMLTYLASNILGTDILSCVIVTVLWGLQTSVYCYHDIRMSK